jgi:type IV pilus assembly protein PilQ
MINRSYSFLSILFFVLLIVLTNVLAAPVATSAANNTQQLSLNFQDIKVRAVLQLLAQFKGLNIVVSDAVQGSMTLHLENVPWDQALAIVLQSQGLGKKQIGNILLIAPLADIAVHEKQALQAEQQLQDLEPLQSVLIQMNYGKATDTAALLQQNKSGTSLLSSRGSVSVDARTNTLWVQDTPEKLAVIRSLIKQLDVPVKQVLIAARIVNVDSGFEQELGVRFGVTKTPHVSGTLPGANALASGTAVGDVPFAQRLNVDLPVTQQGTGSIGLALAKLAPGTLLDLELSALESEGGGQIISNPRLITADQQAAIIESGQEIPYQEQTSSGATNVAFKKAVLSLSVTPQVTPDHKIILTLKVNQDRANFNNLVLGVPPIDTRQIESQVLIDNGQTVVLGGIYETDNSKQVQRIPFFSSLPIVGALFRHSHIVNKRRELLIFVTPHIIDQPADVPHDST